MFNKTIDFRCIFHFIAILNVSAVGGGKAFVGCCLMGGIKRKDRNTLSFTKISVVAAVCVRYFFINSSLWAECVLLGQFLV